MTVEGGRTDSASPAFCTFQWCLKGFTVNCYCEERGWQFCTSISENLQQGSLGAPRVQLHCQRSAWIPKKKISGHSVCALDMNSLLILFNISIIAYVDIFNSSNISYAFYSLMKSLKQQHLTTPPKAVDDIEALGCVSVPGESLAGFLFFTLFLFLADTGPDYWVMG